MGSGLLIMYSGAAIKEVTHTNEKDWYFPLRAIFIFWTGSLWQHDISRELGHMVPQTSLPRVPVATETDGVWGRPEGGGVFRRGAGCSCIFVSAVLASVRMLDVNHAVLLDYILVPLCATPIILLRSLCTRLPPTSDISVDLVACRLLTSMFVCLSACVFVLRWEQGEDKFSALAPDWRQRPFILHCPT